MASANPLRKVIDWFNAQDVVDDDIGDGEPITRQTPPDPQQKRSRAPLVLRDRSEGGMEIRHPRHLDDRMEIGVDLKHRRMVTLDLTHLPDSDARYFLEFIYGVVFALDATAEKVTDGIYLLAPRGISVRNDTEDAESEPASRLATGRSNGHANARDVQEELFWQGS
jgi:hypothetical protein